MKKPLLLFFSMTIFVFFSFFYHTHKLNEVTAFSYAKKFVMSEYSERANLSHGGTRYDCGRGSYFVIVQNRQEKKYYLEVKLGASKELVSIADNTGDTTDSGQ